MKLIYIVLLILLTSCSTLKKNSISDSVNKVNTVTEPKIIFLNYSIIKKTDNTVKFNLINKILADGKLKKNSLHTPSKSKNDLVCVQLDQNLKPTDSIFIPNPLIKNIEYVESSGLMGRKKIELDSVDFNVRMQLNSNTKFLTIKTTNSLIPSLLKTQL